MYAMIAGEKLGPYEIVSLIGKGGMGEVYRAHDSRLDRHDDQLARRLEEIAEAAELMNYCRIRRRNRRLPTLKVYSDGWDKSSSALTFDTR